MVWAGIFPVDTDEYEELRDAMEKLKLNDASLDVDTREQRGSGLRFPLRIPRPAAHGDHPGAAGA
jgi:GTP-binding protein LepA